MAMPVPPVVLSPQVIANAFVEQYYRILHLSPDQVYRFYQESSFLSRSDQNGSMISVTTLQAINEKIQSMDVKNYYWEIETADAQLSYMNGVFIVVTGCLTGPDRISRRFIQSFFLAPQENNGYFVLNDILRVVLDRQALPVSAIPPVLISVTTTTSQVVTENIIVPSQPEPENPVKENGHVQEISTGENGVSKSTPNPLLENGEVELKEKMGEMDLDLPVSVTKEDVIEQPKLKPVEIKPKPKQTHSKPKQQQQQQQQAAQAKESSEETQNDASKKSYASILIKGTPVPKVALSPALKPKPVITEKPDTKPVQTEEAEVVTQINTNGGTNTNTTVSENSSTADAQGYSIYVRNLPLQATVEQLDEQYKKYGTIKPDGIQVKMHKHDPYMFGFVEFETPEAMHAAIQDSPVRIKGKQVYCEEKRGSTRVVNGVPTRTENGIISNGPRGPPFRDGNTNGGYYNGGGYRGGSRGGPPVRGRGGRGYLGTNWSRDGYNRYQSTNGSSNGLGNGRFEYRSNGPKNITSTDNTVTS